METLWIKIVCLNRITETGFAPSSSPLYILFCSLLLNVHFSAGQSYKVIGFKTSIVKRIKGENYFFLNFLWFLTWTSKMALGTILTIYEWGQIDALIRQDCSMRETARKLGRSLCGIQNSFKNKKNYAKRKNPDRSKVLSSRETLVITACFKFR